MRVTSVTIITLAQSDDFYCIIYIKLTSEECQYSHYQVKFGDKLTF